MSREIEGVEPEQFLPPQGMPEPLTFEPNKEYVRGVLERETELGSWDARFLPISDMPQDHRFFEYQGKVNAGGVPSEHVIDLRRQANDGQDYRHASEGNHPVESLRQNTTANHNFAYERALAHIDNLAGAK